MAEGGRQPRGARHALGRQRMHLSAPLLDECAQVVEQVVDLRVGRSEDGSSFDVACSVGMARLKDGRENDRVLYRAPIGHQRGAGEAACTPRGEPRSTHQHR